MTPPDEHYVDPVLAALYDAENSGRDDIEYYLRLARGRRARTVVDLGCGTGVLAADLGAAGHDVIGVDPAAAMLDVARARPGGDAVRCVCGTSADLPNHVADLVVMSGHVAQVFLDDSDWAAVLRDVHRCLRPGGVLAFETRDPAARPWERWTREFTEGGFTAPDGTPFTSWVEVVDVSLPQVSFVGHTVLAGVDRTSSSTLIFRDRANVEKSLSDNGFSLSRVEGDWEGRPPTSDTHELIVTAVRSG